MCDLCGESVPVQTSNDMTLFFFVYKFKQILNSHMEYFCNIHS